MIYSVFGVKAISGSLSGLIKIESEIDGNWIDVTNRCQFVDAGDQGVALLLAHKDGHPFIDDANHSLARAWVTGRYRASIPDSAPDDVREEFGVA